MILPDDPLLSTRAASSHWQTELQQLAYRYSPSGIYPDIASMTERERWECLETLRRRAWKDDGAAP